VSVAVQARSAPRRGTADCRADRRIGRIVQPEQANRRRNDPLPGNAGAILATMP
jgi:hypothetical protein